MADTTRDFGLVTSRRDVVTDVLAVFEADWTNAENDGHVTPAIASPDVVVSPTNSLERLKGLVDSAQKRIDLTVENLGDPDATMKDAFEADWNAAVDVPSPLPSFCPVP